MSAASRAPLRSSSTAVRVRRRAALAAGAAVSALLVSACSSGGTSGGGGQTGFVTGSDGISTVKEGERADAPDLSGKTVDGGQIDVDDYRGKVVVLNVWGSWCPPCRAEAKNFEKVYQDVKDQGVQFVGINTRDTSVGPARAFEEEFGVSYPSLYDPAGKLMLRFEKGTLNPQAIPSTLIIDREGKVAARTLQALSEEKLRKMLEPYLKDTSGGSGK
ncbi:TlpA family protein disulfide reductase [Streptomyces rochei]|uniref:TlpA disulfide reductase family protein n=2 Tax=Streptomyces rochei group TaxID=2867164 RepID=A0AAX3ZKV6_STRRO|nr:MULTISPECIES: TlpA disulfide reductase family protein [Streptomyces]RIH61485.1 TlpA family protein disulfide reductase [Streptomyces sp. SHP22-7]MBU8551199.1 TlpA family protein disulfide reductase [Streptomyces sp. Osf17]MBU8557980.1 TlpA family protein disulfide reductase [Streptomyces sp. Babs14]MBX4174334.1 TlpA family protein disulfide reductase [Streptomyces geysiriensis]RSS68994.1 TlpA family protein disulfide reductase [Streptomyces sp. WAC06273]